MSTSTTREDQAQVPRAWRKPTTGRPAELEQQHLEDALRAVYNTRPQAARQCEPRNRIRGRAVSTKREGRRGDDRSAPLRGSRRGGRQLVAGGPGSASSAAPPRP